MRPSTLGLSLAIVALAGCGGAPDADPGVVAAAGTATGEGGAAPPLGPRNTYRAELLRAAMRGLRYDRGRAEVVPEEAARLAGRPDPAASATAAAEGRALLALNDLIGAIAAHTRAVLLAPESAARYLELGNALLAQRRAEEALAAYRTGIDLEPSHAPLRRAAAVPLIWLGLRAAAVDELREAARLDPADGEALGLMAIQLFYLEDLPAAWQAARRAEALGHELPPQFRALLARRHPESVR